MEVTGDDAELVQLRRDHTTTRNHIQVDLCINFCTNIYVDGRLDRRTLDACVEHVESLGELDR